MASRMSERFLLTSSQKVGLLLTPPSYSASGRGLIERASIYELIRNPAIVIPNDRNRQRIKESLGVKYSVKKAENIEPQIPPIATSDQAYT